jgi:uncharacterized membrane protein required for colicin V production
MLLWIMILVGVLFAYMGYKKGFLVMFATLFNLMFAIFVAVLSAPKLLSFSSGYEDSGYYAAASVLLLFILIFGVLQFFAYLYFLRDSEGLFPKLFDKIGAMVFGFLSGYAICCVLLLAFCIMPFSGKSADGHFYSRDQLEKLSVPGVKKVCNFLAWYSLHCFEGNSEKAIDHLLALDEAQPEEGERINHGISFPNGSPRTP